MVMKPTMVDIVAMNLFAIMVTIIVEAEHCLPHSILSESSNNFPT